MNLSLTSATQWNIIKIKNGDEVLLTKAEHASNILPWFDIKKDIIKDNQSNGKDRIEF